jgi:CHAD domain-containing protein
MNTIEDFTGPASQLPAFDGTLTCEAAFRAAASLYLNAVTAQQKETAAGRAPALHAMRVAMSRLRATIAMFLPMIEGDDRIRLATELKWLNAHLGIVRDLDVAIERLKKNRQPVAAKTSHWRKKRAACQKHLTRALRSLRYQRLVKDMTNWISAGDWTTKPGKKAASQRARSAEDYCAKTLNRWRTKLLKKSRHIEELGTEKRHRVRLANKRLTYAIEAADKLFSPDKISPHQTILISLRKAHRSLGRLNDDARYRELAGALDNDTANAVDLSLKPKEKKRLLRKAIEAYEEIANTELAKMPNRTRTGAVT